MTINKYEAAYFSSVSYSDDSGDFDIDQSYKNQGWTKLKDSNELGLNSDSYYGTCYVKVVNGSVTDVVIAHRGTADLSDVFISDGAIALNLPSNVQVNNSRDFVDKLKIEFQSQYGIDAPFNSITTQTGHSLGGYLAIKSANYQSSDSLHIKTITFDNPKAGYTSSTNKADVETYLNQPNIVNSAGSGDHVGNVYRLNAESPIFNNDIIATLNVITAQSVSYLSGTIAVLATIPAIGVPYAALLTPIILQTAQEHLLTSITSRLNGVSSNDVSIDVIEYYLVGDYAANSNDAVGGVAALQWSYVENKQIFNNNIKEYAARLLNTIRSSNYEYSPSSVIFGSESSEHINGSDGEIKYSSFAIMSLEIGLDRIVNL